MHVIRLSASSCIACLPSVSVCSFCLFRFVCLVWFCVLPSTVAGALGRWVNRQRSAYTKDKLKWQHVEKLNNIGLKWSVHQRQGGTEEPTETLNGDSAEVKHEQKMKNGEETSQKSSAVFIFTP